MIPPSEANLLSGQALAYVGDAVHDLYERMHTIAVGTPVRSMHRSVVARVRCSSQSDSLAALLPLLTPEELLIVKRGRNSRAHHSRPKGSAPADYAKATGLEALLGYLYMTDQRQRIDALLTALHSTTPTNKRPD